jgi:Tfp pilus assembly protein PilO
MDEYGKTMEDFYKRQGINTGDYQEHLQDYIFSQKLQAENEQLKEQIKQMEKQLVAKVEIPPKQSQ